MRHLLTLTNAGAIFPPTSLDTVNLLVEAFFWLIAIALFLQTLALWHKTGAPHPLVCPAQAPLAPFPRDGDSEVERSAPTHPPWRHDAGIVKFFKSFWNLADLVNYSLFMAILGCRIYTLTLLNELDFQPPSSPSRPIELDAGWLRKVTASSLARRCLLRLPFDRYRPLPGLQPHGGHLRHHLVQAPPIPPTFEPPLAGKLAPFLQS